MLSFDFAQSALFGCSGAAFASPPSQALVLSAYAQDMDEEEGEADATITKIATGGIFQSGVNEAASHA